MLPPRGRRHGFVSTAFIFSSTRFQKESMCVTVCEDSHPTNLSAFVDVQSKHQLRIGVGGDQIV